MQEITEDVCIVYGTLWVREKPDPAKSVQAEMDTRFTMVLQNMEDKICIKHIHQSIPYVDQAPGEYYPKTILALANEAIERARHLERGMERDYMTGLYNRYYAEQDVYKRQGRMLFGTDFPMWDHTAELERLQKLGLTDAEMEKILYRNACDVLKEEL